MEPIDVYLMYCAMKAHFSKNEYDFVKYDGKSKVSRDSFGNVVIVHFLQNYHASIKMKTILEITLLQTSPQTMKDG